MKLYHIKDIFRTWSRDSKLFGSFYRWLSRKKTDANQDVDDETFFKKRYRENCGKTLHLDDPKEFNEKLIWLQLHDRDPLYTRLTDKYLVKQWVAERIGKEHVVPLIGVWDSADDILFGDYIHLESLMEKEKRSGSAMRTEGTVRAMRLLFVMEASFPFGTAFSSRARSLCRLFAELGYSVHVIAGVPGSTGERPGTVYEWENATYEIAGDRPASALMTFVGNRALLPCVKRYLAQNNVDILFTSSCFCEFRGLLRAASERNIPMYLEQCEWTDVSNFRFGRFDPRFIRMNGLMNGGCLKVSGILAISRLLHDHYADRGVRTVRVPTILDVCNTEWTQGEAHPRLRLVYTGNCGVSKEFLKPMIEALATNEAYRERVDFHIYGVNEATVSANIGGEALLKAAGESVVVHGKIPQDRIEDILRNADYQVFLRPKRRSSEAGFPTKLGESMAVGTPVIANDTGDIGLYLKDGVNGFIPTDNTTKALCEVLDKVIAVRGEAYAQMRLNARKTAQEAFDYRRYTDTVKELFRNENRNR